MRGSCWYAGRHSRDSPGNLPRDRRAGLARPLLRYDLTLQVQGVSTHGPTFYDHWVDIEVEDPNSYGLTVDEMTWNETSDLTSWTPVRLLEVPSG